jgi:hypothetical protein
MARGIFSVASGNILSRAGIFCRERRIYRGCPSLPPFSRVLHRTATIPLLSPPLSSRHLIVLASCSCAYSFLCRASSHAAIFWSKPSADDDASVAGESKR